jgi:uridine kinase
MAGGSASGKSTFVGILAPILRDGTPPIRVEVFGLDKYFYRGQNGGPTFVSPSTGETLPDNNSPESSDNERLVADLDALRLAPDAPDVIIIEGHLIFAIPAIRERLNLRLFMDLDADIRALRRLLRDIAGGRGSTDPQFIARYYIECARVGHAKYIEPSRIYADMTLRGDADFAQTAPLVAGLIRSQLGD